MPVAKIRICAGCGGEFKGTKTNRGRYCSDACNPGTIIQPKANDEVVSTIVALWNAGESAHAIGRATGLSDRTVRRWTEDLCSKGVLRPREKSYQKQTIERIASEPKATLIRRCLSCSEVFESEGSHNRVCEPCREGSAWKSGCSYWFAA